MCVCGCHGLSVAFLPANVANFQQQNFKVSFILVDNRFSVDLLINLLIILKQLLIQMNPSVSPTLSLKVKTLATLMFNVLYATPKDKMKENVNEK